MSELKEKFCKTISLEYETYLNKLKSTDPMKLIKNADEIAKTQWVFRLLTNNIEPMEEQMEYLMKFQKPLFVIVHSWDYENSFSMKEELEHHLWEMVDKRSEEIDYDLLLDDEQEEDPEVEP